MLTALKKIIEDLLKYPTGYSTERRNKPCAGTLKLATVQSLASIIALNSSSDCLPRPVLSIVAVSALTIPRRNRLPFTRYTRQSPSYSHLLSISWQLNVFTWVLRLEKEVKSVYSFKISAASCNRPTSSLYG